MKQTTYNVPVAVHPGAYLQEWLEEQGMSNKEFALRTGKHEKTISEIVNGKQSVTPEMADTFFLVTGIPTSMWIGLQGKYNEVKVKEKNRSRNELLWNEWACMFPYSAMAKAGWIENAKSKEEKTENLLRYFGTSSAENYTQAYCKRVSYAHYRATGNSRRSEEAVAAWLRQGEIKAMERYSAPYKRAEVRNHIAGIKSAFCKGNLDSVQELCAKAGIRLVFVKNISQSSMSGAAVWLSDIPVIILSEKGQRLDTIAFNFFHELGHIYLHSKGKNTIFVDEKVFGISQEEQEADRFAMETLLDKEAYTSFVANADFELPSVRAFAKAQNVPPCVVLGRLAYEKHIDYKLLHTKYKTQMCNAEIPFS